MTPQAKSLFSAHEPEYLTSRGAREKQQESGGGLRAPCPTRWGQKVARRAFRGALRPESTLATTGALGDEEKAGGLGAGRGRGRAAPG